MSDKNLLTVLQEIAKMETALASCAIEGNAIADKHLKAIEGMDLIAKYQYLTKVFNDLRQRYED